jgi:O-antigen/teichoic acid export membrane protein
MSLARRLVSNTGAAIADLVLSKLAQVLVFALIVRLLEVEAVAAVGVAAGYLVFIAWLDVGPIRVLLRDWPRLKDNPAAADRLLTGLFLFWLGQAVAMFLVALALILWILPLAGLPGLGLVFLAVTVDFVAMSFRDWIKTVFYADLRQWTATWIGLVESVLRLLAFGLLLLFPSLLAYALLLIVMGLIGILLWSAVFLRHFRWRPHPARATLPALRASLADYGLWDHANRMVIDTLFLIDTVILAWFRGAEEIAAYAIALRVTSMLFLIPIQIHRGLQVALVNLPTERRGAASTAVLKLTLLVALGQLAFMAVAGDLLLWALFGRDLPAGTLAYTLIISLAVTVMNLGWPLIAVLNSQASLRRVFVRVFLPMLPAGLALYVAAAAWGGALWLAWANVVVYLLLTLLLAAAVARLAPFRPERTLLAAEERAVLRQLLGRAG